VVDGAGYTLQGTGSEIGLDLSFRSNVTIRNTKIKKFGYGVYLNHSMCNSIEGNIMAENSFESIRIYESSGNNILKNNITATTWDGIVLYGSSNNNIVNNCLMSNYDGIRLYESSNNSIAENIVANNYYGVFLAFSSGNIIAQNNIMANNGNGISLCWSSNENRIVRNDITANDWFGIHINESSNNMIHHNNLLNNTNQVYTENSVNVWDDGMEGNYWSNYTGVDSDHDGIGDTPHVIDANNQDNHPLLGEFHSYHITHIEPGFTLTLVSNSSISNFDVGVWIEHPENRIIHFYAAGETGYGFCRLCIPKNLMAPPYTVIIDNGETPVLHYNETLYDNSTHRWIYFGYEHSTHEIEIIPEFPSAIIPPFLMVLSVIAVVFAKKNAKTEAQLPKFNFYSPSNV